MSSIPLINVLLLFGSHIDLSLLLCVSLSLQSLCFLLFYIHQHPNTFDLDEMSCSIALIPTLARGYIYAAHFSKLNGTPCRTRTHINHTRIMMSYPIRRMAQKRKPRQTTGLQTLNLSTLSAFFLIEHV